MVLVRGDQGGLGGGDVWKDLERRDDRTVSF